METKYGVINHQYETLTTISTFNRVQEIIDGYQSKPKKERTKPFVLKGMITCEACDSVVTPEIKKGRYIYYSCTNSRGECNRVYVREEKLLKPLLEYFDAISLSEERVDNITSHLREIHKSESTFRHEGMTALRREQDKIQRKISQIYGELDGDR